MVNSVGNTLMVAVFLAASTFATAAIPAPAKRLAMQTGAITSQPIGHYEFCQKYKSECKVQTANPKAAALTKAGWRTVRSINASFNRSIKPMTDMDIHGKDEVWSYPSKVGDCEDFVLAKRKALISRGFSPSTLLITVVRKPDGEGHAVLTLRTTEGDFILDNLNDSVRLWTQTPYRFLKRQAANNSGRWVMIQGGVEILVGSVGN